MNEFDPCACRIVQKMLVVCERLLQVLPLQTFVAICSSLIAMCEVRKEHKDWMGKVHPDHMPEAYKTKGCRIKDTAEERPKKGLRCLTLPRMLRDPLNSSSQAITDTKETCMQSPQARLWNLTLSPSSRIQISTQVVFEN